MYTTDFDVCNAYQLSVALFRKPVRMHSIGGSCMLDRFSRQVLHHELKLEPMQTDAPDIYFHHFLPMFESDIENRLARHQSKNDTVLTSISAVSLIDNRFLALLFSSNNLNLTDPAFQNFATLDVRTERKRENEGISASAHALIDIHRDETRGPRYNFLLEDVPGLSRTYLEPLLTSVFKRCASLECLFPDGSTKRARPKATFRSFPSETLRQALEGGALFSIELIKPVIEGGGLDQVGYSLDQREIRQIKINPRPNGEHALDIISQLQRVAIMEGYSDIKVRYRDGTNIENTVRSNLGIANLPDLLVSASSVLTTEIERDQSESVLRQDVCDKMVAILEGLQ